MTFVILPLSDLLESSSEDLVQGRISRFSCERSPELEDYLHNRAIMMEKKGMSRTYLAIDRDTNDILGFFSLGMKCMRVPDNTPISKTMRKRMNIDDETGVAQSFLLGQLARSDCSKTGFGAILIDEAINRLIQANRIVGCRLVRLDCSDDVVDYYECKGFKFINKNSQANLNQMVIMI